MVHSRPKPLLTPEVLFGCLYADMAQQKLDLFQLAPGNMTEPSARPPQIVRRDLAELTPHSVFAYDVPDHFLGDSFTPYGSVLCYATKERPGFNLTRPRPAIDDTLHPVRNGHGSNMAAFAEQIDNSPVIVTTLEMLQGKLSGFRTPQSTPEQEGENGTIPFADQRFAVWATKQVFGLFRAEPVAQPNAQTLGALDTPNAGGQVRAEQSHIGSFVGEPAYRR